MADSSSSQTDENGHGFWSDGTWQNLNLANAPVRPFKKSSIDGSNYLLSVGEEVYVSAGNSSNTVKQLKEEETFSIDPGQFAFILTEEKVIIPFDKIGFISIRASVKFWGLVNISGFHVDPGYNGRLIFAVFNAGPIRIHLKRGEKVFPIWIASLDKAMTKSEWKMGYDKIPSKLINSVSGDFTTAYQLAEQLKSAKADIVELKSFKLYSQVVAAFLLIVLAPYIKSTLERVLTSPPEVSLENNSHVGPLSNVHP